MIVRKLFFGVLGLAIYLCTNFAFQKGFASSFSFFSTEEERPATDDSATIQVALLLDTSSSMSGLIEQAKSQLWNILNELSRTTKSGSDTDLEIALYEYGNPSKATRPEQINQLSPFTKDMDLISEKLFSLTTNGGDEYCGSIIKASVDDLEWASSNGLKIIYIAGNEGYTQGPIHYETASKLATEKGITINTIFCGDYTTGIKQGWQEGALAGGGDYLHISQNAQTVYVPTPYDQEINRLNSELNKTYIPYGEKGKSKKENQMRQDDNAGSYSLSNAVDRAAFKSSKKYKATDWDLVDAYTKDKSVLQKAEIHSDTLQQLSIEELEQRIEQVSIQRAAIQDKIQALDEKRREYKASNVTNKEASSLQKSMISTIKKQAIQKGYEIKE